MFQTPFFIILFLLVIPHQTAQHYPNSKFISSPEIINQTCAKCAELSDVFSYDFCAASLQTIPVSHATTNRQGLALVAMELALANATTTVLTIKEMLNTNDSTSLDPFSSICLKDCLELYSDGIATLVDAVGAFMSQKYETAGVLLSAVMEAPVTCEEGFEEMKGQVESPVVKENYDLFQLCDIALCIARLLSSHWWV
ncbi:Pectinesterase inhibitor domain containing protein [Parasponia andersonii]|uniref:Pectinesterase inhibitor domain containing protein n=1 Tax=Parasponia andersonii TaxID=3476 RepID=A0A2P5BEB6_PARAD|nr:Pectinesterase inhibitor domain containing protein [Parasponia andersonii]